MFCYTQAKYKLGLAFFKIPILYTCLQEKTNVSKQIKNQHCMLFSSIAVQFISRNSTPSCEVHVIINILLSDVHNPCLYEEGILVCVHVLDISTRRNQHRVYYTV